MKIRMVKVLLAAVVMTLVWGTAFADVVIIDGSDTLDWGRVMSSYHWKDKDTILRPNALLKFGLMDIPANAKVTSAVLNFYTEKSQPGKTISIGHVADHSWSFLTTDPAALYTWPVAHTILKYATGSAGWRTVDVTADIQEELQTGSRIISLKWTDDLFGYPQERIVSPSSRDSDRRPYLKVEYMTITPVAPPPDLTLGPSGIRLSDPTPSPKQRIQVTATVHNNGANYARDVKVRLFDGNPDSGGIPVASSQRIALIPGGGGTGQATFKWSISPGSHRLFVVVDPDNAVSESDEANNREFTDVVVRKDYTAYYEDFETEAVSGSGTVTWQGADKDRGPWVVDGDVPFDPNINLARQWQVQRTGTDAYEGNNSLFMYLDGSSDDGTIWVERWITVDPNTALTVDLSFAFGKQANIAAFPVYSIGFVDPEVEDDFKLLPLKDGWNIYSASVPVFTGRNTRLWVAVGLTVSWETEVYHYLDRIKVTLRSD